MFKWNALTPNTCVRNASQIDGFAASTQQNFQDLGMELNWQHGNDSEEAKKEMVKGNSSVVSFTWRGAGLIHSKRQRVRETWGVSITSVDSYREDWFCQFLKQVSKSTELLPQSWRQSLLHTSYLLDKQSKALGSVEREGCGQCLWLTAHSEELRKQRYKL